MKIPHCGDQDGIGNNGRLRIPSGLEFRRTFRLQVKETSTVGLEAKEETMLRISATSAI